MFRFKQLLCRCALVSAIAVLVMVPSQQALAVVKTQLITDAAGKPLANQKVTITFPDGTKKEDESDDKGLVIWDADQAGDYVLEYPGGKMTVSAAAGGGGSNWLYPAIGAAAVIGGAAALDDDNNDSGGSPGGGAADCSGTDLAVDWQIITFTVTFNPGGHPSLFANSFCDLVNAGGSAVNIPCSGSGWTATASNVPILSGCSVDTSLTGTYAGFTTTFSLDATFDVEAGTWSGQISAGEDGGLPGGQAIRGDFTGAVD